MARLYAPRDDGRIAPGERVFYTRRNAEYIDTARNALQCILASVSLPLPVFSRFEFPCHILRVKEYLFLLERPACVLRGGDIGLARGGAGW